MSKVEYDPNNLDNFDTSFKEEISSTQYAQFLLLFSMSWDTLGTFLLRYWRLGVDYMNSHGIPHAATQGFMIDIAAMHPVITLTCIAGVAVITAFACMYYYFDESYKNQIKKQDAKNTHTIIQAALEKEKKEGNYPSLTETIIISPDIEKTVKIKAFLELPLHEKNRILEFVLKHDSSFKDHDAVFSENNNKTQLKTKPKYSFSNILSSKWMMITVAVVIYWILWISVASITGVLGAGVVGLSPLIGFGLPLITGLGYLALRAKHFYDHRKENAIPNLKEKMLSDQLLLACSKETCIEPPTPTPTKNKYFWARMASTAVIAAVNAHLIAQYALWFASDKFAILAVGAALPALSWAAIILPVIVGGVYAYHKYKEMTAEEPEKPTSTDLEEHLETLKKEALTNREALDDNFKRIPGLHFASRMMGRFIKSRFNDFIQYFMTAAFIARLYTLGSTSPFVIFNVLHAAAWLSLPATLGIIAAVGVTYAAFRLVNKYIFERPATLKEQIAAFEKEIELGEQMKSADPTINKTPSRSSTPIRPSKEFSNDDTSWAFNPIFKSLRLLPSNCCRTADDTLSPRRKH